MLILLSLPFSYYTLFRAALQVYYSRAKNDPIQTDFILSLSAAHGVLPYSERIDKGGNKPKSDISKYNIARINDLLVNCMNILSGSCGITKWDGAISPVYYALYPRNNKEVNIQYYSYIFRLITFYRSLIGISKGILVHESSTGSLNTIRLRVAMQSMNYVALPLPPRTEQDQIVRFLDWKVSQTNRLINAKKKQIGLLQEQKRAVINEAVTRGGEGWERKSLKYWVKSNLSSLGQNTDPEFEFDYLDISSVGHGYIKQAPTHMTFGQSPSRARRIVKYGDTIISTVRTYLRSVCFINQKYEHCIVSTGFSVLSPDETAVLPELLSFVLSSDAFVDDVVKNSIGVSYPAINDSKLLTLKISLPLSLTEQRSVYDTLKEKVVTYDDLVAKVQQEISLLHEYRTRLISDVVTGKMDVRDVEVPQYETVEEELLDEDDEEMEE